MSPELKTKFNLLPERVKQLLRPSLRVRAVKTKMEEFEIGESRIGGIPDLPIEFEWPYYDDFALSFIAQLNLASLPKEIEVLPLPKDGSLAYFYDSQQRTWGFDPKDRGSAIVAYFPAKTELVRTELPEDVDEEGDFLSCSLSYSLEQNLPDPWSPLYQPQLSDREREMLCEFADELRAAAPTPQHRIGGHADCVQNPMELECQLVANGLYCGDASGYQDKRSEELAAGASNWRLLLQVDTDDNAGMMWGDCGMIYYWIREQDLRVKDFDNTWLILQCS